ncbi:Uncharacterised protein [uncultured archaeon]|nr:Uncharacterised protein [uncultured archaeon]
MKTLISLHSYLYTVNKMKVYICEKSCCPAVETIGDEVLIGEDTNMVRLKKNEWNKLVEKIQSGELRSL